MLHSEFHSAMHAAVSSFVVGWVQNPQKGDELIEDYTGNPLEIGAKIIIPPLMPCGSCCHLGFDKAPHLWDGSAFAAGDIWQGIADAISAAREMRCLKATIVPTPEIIDREGRVPSRRRGRWRAQRQAAARSRRRGSRPQRRRRSGR